MNSTPYLNPIADGVCKALNDPYFMVDIETLSTEPNAAILTIGCTIFDPRGFDTEDTIKAEGRCLNIGPITIESNEQVGRHISGSTVTWWFGQEDAAIKALVNGERINLNNALYQMWQFVDKYPTKLNFVVANSPNFDCTILETACRSVGQPWPFKFWQYLDLRTVKQLAYPDGDCPKIGVGVAHNAMDDAIRQALTWQHCTHVLEGRVSRREI